MTASGMSPASPENNGHSNSANAGRGEIFSGGDDDDDDDD